MNLDHVSLPTGRNHLKAMRDFYVDMLTPFGYVILHQLDGGFCGLQSHRGPDFWLHCGGEEFDPIDRDATADEIRKDRGRPHVAFMAKDREQVDEWYKHAVKIGGIPNGEPGERVRQELLRCVCAGPAGE